MIHAQRSTKNHQAGLPSITLVTRRRLDLPHCSVVTKKPIVVSRARPYYNAQIIMAGRPSFSSWRQRFTWSLSLPPVGVGSEHLGLPCRQAVRGDRESTNARHN